MKRISAAFLILLGLASAALAQTVTNPQSNAGVYGAYNSGAPTCVDGSGCWFQTDINGNIKVNIVSGGGSGGTASSFGAAFPATGTAVGAKDSAGVNMQPLNLDASGFLKVNVAAGGAGGGAVTVADGADVTQGAIADAVVAAGAAGTESAKLRRLTTDLSAALTKLDTVITNTSSAIPPQSDTVPIGGVGICDGANGATNPCTTAQTVLAASTASAAANKPAVVALHPSSGTPAQINQYPFGATPITASATGTTGATTATLAGTSGKTTYICWHSIRANATAAATVTNTITGTITGTLSSIMWVAPLASGIGVDEMIYNPCVPASATNTGIAVVSGAPGSGGTVSSKAGGYQL